MLKIGTHDWVKTLKEMTEPLGADFWSGFTPATEQQMAAAERVLKRKFDPEFREFYRTVGYGSFPNYSGDFWSPEELDFGAGPAIYFITGSLSPGDEWATPEEHTALWISRGRENPNPARFTEEVMTLEGVKLYDLLQFGSNGCACYHQLYMGPEPAPLRYCLLTDSQTMEDRAQTFSEGLEKIIEFHLLDPEDAEGESQNVLSTSSHDFINQLVKSSGLFHEDEHLGQFGYLDGAWSLRAKVDLHFQADVPIGFDLETDTRRFPESMPRNVLWIQDNLGEIWNAAARLVNAFVEEKSISAPERFALRHLWANIPDAALDAAEWKFIVEVEDMHESFEVVFHGLEPVSCNAA